MYRYHSIADDNPASPARSPMFHLLVCDDHPAIRLSLGVYAGRAISGCQVCETSNAAQLLAVLREERPFDLLVLDVHLPGPSGLSVLKQVKELRPGLPIMMFSADESAQAVSQALEGGATSYLFKSSAEQVFIEAFADAARKHITLPGTFLAPRASPSAHQPIRLSRRQRDVLGCLLRGMSAKQIARALQIAEGTVKSHTVAVFQAFNVNSRSQVVAAAYRQGISLDG
jgi:two-component system, NarL family, nitrate/nitrite response regulator NarL